MKNSNLLYSLRLRLDAWLEVLSRYRSVGRAAWAERSSYDETQRTAQEAEFLPAALAVQETPVHPVPRATAALLMVLILLAVLASIFFKTEIVVSAPGQVLSSGNTKSIQSLEAAVVRRILVRDGDLVRAGDVLAELFIPGVGTDSARLRSELEEAENEYQRSRKMLSLIEAGKVQASGSDLLEGRMREFRDKILRLEAEVDRRSQETQTMQAMVRKIDSLLPNLLQRVDDYSKLEPQGYVSKHAVLDQLQALAEMQSERKVIENRVKESQAQVNESRRALHALNSEVRRTTMEQMRDANAKRQTASQDLQKFSSRDELMLLRAPIDGHVQQVSIHTPGGVIGASQVLMNLVPALDPLEVEIILENKDIGRLHPGMSAQIKVDTFPYTRFGTIPATVRLISSDAIQDEKRGPIFKARLVLSKTELSAADIKYKLSPGMTTVAEIKIGYRRIIHYFLDPFMRNIGESIREW